MMRCEKDSTLQARYEDGGGAGAEGAVPLETGRGTEKSPLEPPGVSPANT